MSRKKKKEETV